MYHNVHVLILPDMYIHVHTCVHVHSYVVFICTYVYRYIHTCPWDTHYQFSIKTLLSHVCTHMYTLTHILFLCMYIQVNTVGHILDDQQIHFVWYKRDFESRELVLSDARVNSCLLAISIWPCFQTFSTSSSTPWNQILWIHAPWKVMYIYPKVRPSANASSHKSPSQWQDIRVWNDIYRHICIYINL